MATQSEDLMAGEGEITNESVCAWRRPPDFQRSLGPGLGHMTPILPMGLSRVVVVGLTSKKL